MATRHGVDPRFGTGLPFHTMSVAGKFGRMFPTLAPFEPDPADLENLGAAMIEADPIAPASDNLVIPAGFTYLGQFVDHDITFDPTPLSNQTDDPFRRRNFRSPRLDLDSLYGAGPDDQPYLYARGTGGQFRVGTNPSSSDASGVAIPSLPNDLPRDEQRHALIGDPRNDENLAVAQFHLLMMKFHNKVFAGLPAGPSRFETARETVRWHYQWVVLFDFIRRLVSEPVLRDVLENGRRFYLPARESYIPVEFSVAAYRLGHTMVREAYDWNRVFHGQTSLPRLSNGTLGLLFNFTGNGGGAPVPSNWAIDWRQFFTLDRTGALLPTINASRKLDTKLAPALGALPGFPPGQNNLAIRNLLRGRSLGLPTGQAVAALMGLSALTPAQVLQDSTPGETAAIQAGGFDVKTPLWYYVLKEAQISGNGGERLGPVGARIIAEVFVGLIQSDEQSFLARAPEWKPTLASAVPNDFTMVDLINFTADPLKNGP